MPAARSATKKKRPQATPPPEDFGWRELYELAVSRKRERPPKSRTTRLFQGGIEGIATKLGEGAVVTALAAQRGEPGVFIGAATDLLYHLTVLMATVGVTPDQVLELLRERHELLEREKERPRRRGTTRK